jgi:hypothetical protein
MQDASELEALSLCGAKLEFAALNPPPVCVIAYNVVQSTITSVQSKSAKKK